MDQEENSSLVYGFIPARMASSRFPGKMLYPLMDKPVVQHTFDRAKQATFLDDLFLLTDDEKLFETAVAFGAQSLITDVNCINGTYRLIDALERYPHLQKAEIVVLIQGDHPLLDPATIQTLVQTLKEDKEAVMSTSLVPIKDQEAILDPNVVKCVFDANGYALYFSRSPIPYYRNMSGKSSAFQHIGLYAYRTSFLLHKLASLPPSALQVAEDLEQLQVLEAGYKIITCVVKETPLAVDVPEDIIKIENYLGSLSKTSLN